MPIHNVSTNTHIITSKTAVNSLKFYFLYNFNSSQNDIYEKNNIFLLFLTYFFF